MHEVQQNNDGWNNLERWVIELIQQSKTNSKRWFIAFIATLVAMIGTNAYWIYVFQSYDYVSQDGSGLNNYNTGYQGDVIGSESQTETEREQ